MSSTTETQRVSAGAVNRSWRNYLLEPSFQLKYTGMVVGVTLAVSAVLGIFAYRFSLSVSDSTKIMLVNDPNLSQENLDRMLRDVDANDQKVALSIVGGVALLCVALGITGILVTHKIVGPAYKLRLLLRHMANGRLELTGRLRDGDELQSVFAELEKMVDSLRRIQQEEIDDLEAGIEQARRAGVTEQQLVHLLSVRDRMKSAL